jgi:hypothetical protein
LAPVFAPSATSEEGERPAERAETNGTDGL